MKREIIRKNTRIASESEKADILKYKISKLKKKGTIDGNDDEIDAYTYF